MFTERQQRTLDALCRRIVPACFEGPVVVDLPGEIAARLSDSSPHNRVLALKALNALGNPAFSFVLTGRFREFGLLTPVLQNCVLTRCENSRVAVLRLLFGSLKRLIVNTWYGLPRAHHEIGYAPGMQSPLPDAGPVVASSTREREGTRIVPAGVQETYSHDLEITTEYCVIGSGVGGSVAACVLSEAGRDVVILEAGPYRTAADFITNETNAVRDLYADAALRTTEDLGISLLQGQCAGGGSTVNWMVMLRTPDYVLSEWASRYGVEDMSAAEMRSVFERFESESGVGAIAEHAHSRANRILLDGARTLGWRVSGASVNARGCLRTGLCGLGCPYDAKQGMTKTYLARALATGARLYCGVQAQHITANSVRTIHATTRDGHRITIRADKIIIAAGAVETPALLQRSGIGNSGQHLRLHPTTAVVGVYEDPVLAGGGIPLSTYCNEFTQLRGDYGHWIETPPLTPGLASIALPGFGEVHRSQMKQYPYLAPLIVLVRDGSPNDPSRGTVRWQRDGRARIDYALSSADREILVHGMESAARIHFAMGAKEVFTLHRNRHRMRDAAETTLISEVNDQMGNPLLFSAHVNGTARISASAQDGTCKADGSVRGAPGVYVMDGSLLPTAPGVNPHETIAGVVAVLAEKLVQ